MYTLNSKKKKINYLTLKKNLDSRELDVTLTGNEYNYRWSWGGGGVVRGPWPPLAFETFHYSSFTFVNKSKNYTKMYSPALPPKKIF